VFDDIEFFLPQIAHVLIHIDSASSVHILERLAIVICQSSMHTALQLSFILFAAMEDYQQEDLQGHPNPSANYSLFSRCARLLQDIERAVVYGSSVPPNVQPYTGHASQLSSLQYAELADKYRLESARQIVDLSTHSNKLNQGASSVIKKGMLMFKRVTRQSWHNRKIWKERWFTINEKVLLCYHDDTYTTLRRTIPLQDCSVGIVSNPNHTNCFEVHSPITGTLFKLKAETQPEMMGWIDAINS
jgi:phosphatidylinositol 4-kinase